jgi:hypothetical protein
MKLCIKINLFRLSLAQKLKLNISLIFDKKRHLTYQPLTQVQNN